MDGMKSTSRICRTFLIMLAFMLMITFLGISGTDVYAASKLTVKPTAKTLEIGKVTTLKANKSVKWTVVSGKGNVKLYSKKSKSVKVKALKSGKATVKAKALKGGKYKFVKITVRAAESTENQLNNVLSGKDTKTTLIDARDSDAYAGWALGEATNGGHFKNAINLDAAWLSKTDKFDNMISENGMSPEKSYIVYDTNGEDAKAVAEYLKNKGYNKVKAINAVKQINSRNDLETYKNYKMTVPASVVKNVSDHVVKGTELNKDAKDIVGNSKKIVIIDTAWGSPTASGYTAGHVPGAVHIDTDETDPPIVYEETGDKYYENDYKLEWRLNTDDNLIKLFYSRGVTTDSCVFVTGSATPVNRIAVILKYMGVDNTHTMSKGLDGWKSAGYELETENRNAKIENGNDEISKIDLNTAVKGFGTDKPKNPSLYEKYDYVKEHVGKDNNYQLIDDRRDDEWNGEVTGYRYHDLAGRIPGSIHSIEANSNPDGTIKSKELMAAKWTKDGVDLNKHMVFFCGNGWRAANDTWTAWTHGYDAAIYNGWMEWSNIGLPYINKAGKTVHFDKTKQAEVDENGNVIAYKKSKFQFNNDTVTVTKEGEYTDLNSLNNAIGAKVTYSSSDSSVTVDANGVVKVTKEAIEAGKIITITAISDKPDPFDSNKKRSTEYTIKFHG